MFRHFPEDVPSPYESMTIEEVIEGALGQLDSVTLSPQEAQLILAYRLQLVRTVLEDDSIGPDEVVSDELFALGEIAQGKNLQNFGAVYRKYHVSSADEPVMGGLRETALATDLADGAIWGAILAQQSVIEPPRSY
jgi:hypothetical protein